MLIMEKIAIKRRIKIGVAIVVVLFVLFLISQTDRASKQYRHLVSGVSGLERTVTLYDCNGEILSSWSGNFMVETSDGVISFIHNDKEIKVSGIIIIKQNK